MWSKIQPCQNVPHSHSDLLELSCKNNNFHNICSQKFFSFIIIWSSSEMRALRLATTRVCKTLKCQMSGVKFCDKNLPCHDHHQTLHLDRVEIPRCQIQSSSSSNTSLYNCVKISKCQMRDWRNFYKATWVSDVTSGTPYVCNLSSSSLSSLGPGRPSAGRA